MKSVLEGNATDLTSLMVCQLFLKRYGGTSKLEKPDIPEILVYHLAGLLTFIKSSMEMQV